MQNNITIIIPIYNEGENIGLLIDEIFLNFEHINILLIDDLSTDNSIIIVKNKIKLYGNNIVLIAKNKIIDGKGLTYSIIKGINKVDTKYFIVMDGDFQHPVNSINDFLRLFKEGKNVIIGERDKIIFEEKKYRIFISKIGNYLINLKLRKNNFSLKDPLSGFFGGDSSLYKSVIVKNKTKFIGNGYKFLFEFLKLVQNNKVLLGTFNFNFGKRKFGVSKISSRIYIDFIKGLLKK